MPRVIHFEIPVDDPERAIKFYGNVFGWDIQGWGGPAAYWLASTGPEEEPGIDGAFTRRDGTFGAIHVSVPSVDAYVGRIEEAGGEVVHPKSSIPGVGYAAYCRDPEGNVFGIFQPDPKAS